MGLTCGWLNGNFGFSESCGGSFLQTRLGRVQRAFVSGDLFVKRTRKAFILAGQKLQHGAARQNETPMNKIRVQLYDTLGRRARLDDEGEKGSYDCPPITKYAVRASMRKASKKR